ncbi:MAG: PilT domain protein [Dehalococcoidia bacterium]|nr:PilT domain protein [Dehalococcoidia bacterium]
MLLRRISRRQSGRFFRIGTCDMALYICDTHPLVWYFTGSAMLSQRAYDIVSRGERGLDQIVIPTIVLAELLVIAEKRRAPVDLSTVVAIIHGGQGFFIQSLNWPVFEHMMLLGSDLELHDRTIAATAMLLGAPVITRDPKIGAKVPVIW